MFEKLKSLNMFPTILVILVTIISIYSQYVPLLSTLHFEYSVLSALILFISSGLLTVYFLRKYNSLGVLIPMLVTKYKLYLLLLFVPILISLVFNIVFQKCPICDGILFYMIISVPSFYFGFVSAVFSFFLSKKFSFLLFTGSLLLFILLPLLEFYFNPQIYFYNPIIGIFPGTIYDEEISITSSLLIYRIMNIIFFSVILYVIIKIGNKRDIKRYFIYSGILIISVIWIFTKQFLGFSSSTSSIENNLKGIALTSKYKIVYPLNIKENKKRLIVLEHEYYNKSLKHKTNLSPSSFITSFIFEDSNQKGKLFGTKAANVAKPWLSQIYLDQYSLSNTLEHELSHIFASEIGSMIFKITPSFNFALLEGYAMAMENNYAGFDIDYLAYLGNNSDYRIDLESLFSKLNFFASSSSLSYIYAGSFIKYLIKKYGITSVNNVYQDLDFQKHIGKDLSKLSNEYMSYLDSLDYPINLNRANLFFGYKPLIKKTCPREVANGLKAAWAEYSSSSFVLAKEKFYDIYSYSNSYSALIGIIYCNNKIGNEEESKKILENSLDDYIGTSSYFSALLNYGDQLALTNEIQRADSIYTILAEMKPTIRYYNIATIRKILLAESENKILYYLRGSDFDKYSILKNMNIFRLSEQSIPIMLELSKRLNENVDHLSSYLKTKSNIDETITSNTAFVLSKYYYENYKFNEALFYAKLSIDKCDESYRISILKSNKNKIEWINQHKDEILSKTKFSVYN